MGYVSHFIDGRKKLLSTSLLLISKIFTFFSLFFTLFIIVAALLPLFAHCRIRGQMSCEAPCAILGANVPPRAKGHRHNICVLVEIGKTVRKLLNFILKIEF